MEEILEKINKSGLKLLGTMTPEETYAEIVNEAMHLVDAEYGSIILKINDKLERVYASHPFYYKIKMRKEGNVESAFRDNKLVVNSANKVGKVHPIVKKMGVQSVILIPLSYHGESIGMLSLHSLKKEHFNQKEVNILRLFGSMASLAIKKSQLYSETKKALEIRDMFISMAAHELRTPITSISGYIQLLYGKLANREGVEGKWIRELNEENKRLTALVKELLEVNRLKTGQIQFMWQECGLEGLLVEAIGEAKQLNSDRTITFENKASDSDDKIIGDGNKLIHVFLNIIDNALKYSPKTEPVNVILTKKASEFIVAIKDYGKGIDKEDLPHIFDGHHKGSGGDEGFGIGLFFVESVIRQHRGDINVKSKPKKGTTFEVKLPRAKYGR